MINKTAAQMADALAKGETTSVELTQLHRADHFRQVVTIDRLQHRQLEGGIVNHPPAFLGFGVQTGLQAFPGQTVLGIGVVEVEVIGYLIAVTPEGGSCNDRPTVVEDGLLAFQLQDAGVGVPVVGFDVEPRQGGRSDLPHKLRQVLRDVPPVQ